MGLLLIQVVCFWFSPLSLFLARNNGFCLIRNRGAVENGRLFRWRDGPAKPEPMQILSGVGRCPVTSKMTHASVDLETYAAWLVKRVLEIRHRSDWLALADHDGKPGWPGRSRNYKRPNLRRRCSHICQQPSHTRGGWVPASGAKSRLRRRRRGHIAGIASLRDLSVDSRPP